MPIEVDYGRAEGGKLAEQAVRSGDGGGKPRLSGVGTPLEHRATLSLTMLLENCPYPQDVRVRNEAMALSGAGYRVRVIAPRAKGQSSHEVIDGVVVERFRAPLVHSGGSGWMVLEYLVAHTQLYWRGLRAITRGTDVIHAHNPPDTMFPLGLLGRAVGRKFVFDQHDLFPALTRDKYSIRALARLARASQWISMRVASLIITTNVSQRTEALEDKHNSADDVIIVRNGVHSAALNQHRPDPRPGALQDPHLVYVGALETQDGTDVLPTILSLLVEDHHLHGARLTIVGDGSQLRVLKADIEAKGLGDRVEFTGLVRHERALEVIAGADICLDVAPCNDFNHRTTMVKIIEYITLGKPVVSFPLRETMRLGGDAIAYARCHDAESFAACVAGLAESEALRAKLVARTQKVAGGLVWERSAETLLEGYRGLERASGSSLRRRAAHALRSLTRSSSV